MEQKRGERAGESAWFVNDTVCTMLLIHDVMRLSQVRSQKGPRAGEGPSAPQLSVNPPLRLSQQRVYSAGLQVCVVIMCR